MAEESWKVPALVQDLAADAAEPPSRYVVPEEDRPGSLLLAPDMPEPIPIVDLSRVLTDADEAGKLRSALQTWGFVLVTNHGVEASLMDRRDGRITGVFPAATGGQAEVQQPGRGEGLQVEGYGSDPVATKEEILNWSDRLHLNVEPEDDRDLTQWPEYPASFRDVLQEYTSKTKTVRDTILRAMALVFELEEDYFISQTRDKALAFARFNYYPPCPKPELVFGHRPHTDSSVLTILLTDGVVSALQVRRDGMWYTVPCQPHTLLIFLGDSMEIMSNGEFKSPMHRVVTNQERERISLAMFYFADDGQVLEPAAALLDAKRPARYRKITARDYMAGVFEVYSRGGTRFIETLKI
ncbi:hypothetical protein ACP4OV_006614 [Aristida adscensionis]